MTEQTTGGPSSPESPGRAELYHSSEEGARVRAFGININMPEERYRRREHGKDQMRKGVEERYQRRWDYKEGSMRKRRLKYLALVPAVFGSVMLGAFFIGWIFMLVVGAIWHEFGFLAPVGFWPALGISLGLLVILSMLTSGVKVND